MTGTKKILIVVTSHQEWSEAERKTGYLTETLAARLGAARPRSHARQL
jgi:hypothetical protein